MAGGAAEWVRQSIVDGKHFFAAPVAFNDPFDCAPHFSLEASQSDLYSYYERLIRKYEAAPNRALIRAEARRRLRDPTSDPRRPENMAEFVSMYRRAVTDKVGMLCVSATGTDILMWSHYADSHRGVCFVFDGSAETFANAHPVNYSPRRPEVNPIKHTYEQMLDAALFTKSDHWSYEKEWRLVQYTRGRGVYVMPPATLVAVILGAKTSSEDRDCIRSWAAASPAQPQVLEASLSERSFEVLLDQALP